ncbi:hypothetical protein J2W22_002101 [Sphingomonas kyeonggiensis]|uniref:hypothetical protein n=1 Tax=Sphingomonas kyeonggiensis TaxID=1268553 RepID=UPI0027836D8B|nr:hypothetical protein [Sphingomonas kyeonggiensis]MDQ0250037.1 hypothetical protein [Sphingomonas kyeonggiensis]
MGYWIKRIVLQTGEIVTERELRVDENRFEGPAPLVGDVVEVECRGRKFPAKVIWGNWPGRHHPDEAIVPLRVAELDASAPTPPAHRPA